MIKKRPVYKVLATDTSKTRFDNIIYSDGSIETLCDKENKEEYEEENIIRINGFKKITQNGISPPTYYEPANNEDIKAFLTLRALYGEPYDEPKKLEIETRKYKYGIIEDDDGNENKSLRYKYILEYFGEGEPWFNDYLRTGAIR